ncbi:MAG TPA: response regulator transcription factor [Polyangiaceae bacterium]|nr:response regulator transcription factor [Polyangiaceae bacterium]
MTIAPVILVIEDELNTRTLIQVTLAQGGYHTIHASTGVSGIAATFDNAPNAVLLDLGLPDLHGVEVTRRIRQRSAVPIIVVSARGKEADKVEALDNGANDYLTKPFGAGELLARIRVMLRTVTSVSEPPRDSTTLTSGDLSLDFNLRTVSVKGVDVYLTKIEFSLLATMMASPGRVLTHQQILRQVWGPRFAAEVNYLRVYMKKLRHKIEPEPARPRYLVNEPGIGYRLRLPSQSR